MTIYDIAEKAGVSASTVSRVVNNKPGVRPTVRKSIKRLLEKFNYSPNETARSLVAQSSRMIGILIGDIRNIHHTDGAYIIERELAKLGYCCIIFNTGSEDSAKAEYLQILAQRRVEGAILIGSQFQSDIVVSAISRYLSDVPVFISNGYIDLPNVYSVLADERGGVSKCVEMLFLRGKHKISFVIDQYTPSNKLKLQGYKEVVIQHNNTPLVFECDSSLCGGYDITCEIMKTNRDVDGIIYAVDLLAAGGVRALMDQKIVIPKQVAVVGIDNSIYCEICNPRLTSLDNKLLDVHITIARHIGDILEGRKIIKKMLVFSDIVCRETT
jgi:LacI family transcriptional regulator